MINLLFHLLMVLVDAAALTLLARRPGVLRFLMGFVAVAVATWLLATVLGRQVVGSTFAYLRLLSFGVAVHWPVYSGAAAWFLWRGNRRRAALTPAALALVIGAAAVDAFMVEPRWLEVSKHTITTTKLDEPLRIVVLADYQTDKLGAYERHVWRRANEQDADLILMPGDYLQVHGEGPEYRSLMEETRQYLREIRFGQGARLGAFAVGGDVEYNRPDWAELFDGTPVTTLGDTRTLELPDLTLTSLSLADTRNRELTLPASERFHVSFGHTHGGQLRVPGLGPLLTFSRVPREWAAGVTDLGRGRTLVVSRGTGMERGRAPRMRFLCRPEIVVLDVRPAIRGR